ELTLRRLLLHRAGDAVRTEDHRGIVRNLAQLLDEYRAKGAQTFHDIAVVHDLVAHIDWRAEQCQRALDDIDRTVHSGTESTRIGEQQSHRHAQRFTADAEPERLLSRIASRISSPAPIVMEVSAMLNA